MASQASAFRSLVVAKEERAHSNIAHEQSAPECHSCDHARRVHGPEDRGKSECRTEDASDECLGEKAPFIGASFTLELLEFLRSFFEVLRSTPGRGGHMAA
jgi:hypothetical protein